MMRTTLVISLVVLSELAFADQLTTQKAISNFQANYNFNTEGALERLGLLKQNDAERVQAITFLSTKVCKENQARDFVLDLISTGGENFRIRPPLDALKPLIDGLKPCFETDRTVKQALTQAFMSKSSFNVWNTLEDHAAEVYFCAQTPQGKARLIEGLAEEVIPLDRPDEIIIYHNFFPFPSEFNDLTTAPRAAVLFRCGWDKDTGSEAYLLRYELRARGFATQGKYINYYWLLHSIVNYC